MLRPSEITADIAFIGIPYGSDDGSSRAPEAVRDAAVYYHSDRRGDSPAKGYYDFDEDREFLKGITMVDAGDVPIASAPSVLRAARLVGGDNAARALGIGQISRRRRGHR